MSQAIVTKYHGPGNVRGATIIARASAGSVRFGYEHRLNMTENHREAAKMLAAKMKWEGHYVAGGFWDGSYVFVCVNDRAKDSEFTLPETEV